MGQRAPVEVVQGLREVTYRMGWRQLGWRRWGLVARALFSVGLAVGLTMWFHGWVWWIKDGVAVMGVWGLLPMMLPSRAEVVVADGKVRWREVGWLKREWASVEEGSIVRWRVDAARQQRYAGGTLGRWAAVGDVHLVAELAGGGEVPVVVGYPREVVAEMAALLGEAVGSGKGEVVDVSEIPWAARDVEERPAGCGVGRIEMEGVETFRYTRMGVVGFWMRVAGGLVAYVVLMGVLTVLMLAFVHAVRGRIGLWVVLPVVVDVGILWSGVGSLRRLWRHVVIVASAEELVVVWRGGFGQREAHWGREQVGAVRVEEFAAEHFRVQRGGGNFWLVVVERMGKETAVAGGDPGTWQWVATRLRRVLGVGAV